MKRYVLVAVIVLLVILFFSPFISDRDVYMTRVQRDRSDENCRLQGCGLIIDISPYEYVKKSVSNLIVQN